jgi:hypothetical protein
MCCLESLKDPLESPKLNHPTASFRGLRYKYPFTPFTLTVSPDQFSPASILEHSRALLTPSFDFQARFGEGIEGKLEGEKVRVLVN